MNWYAWYLFPTLTQEERRERIRIQVNTEESWIDNRAGRVMSKEGFIKLRSHYYTYFKFSTVKFSFYGQANRKEYLALLTSQN